MSIRLLSGDCRDVLATLPAESVQCVVTSPPYYALRSYLDATHPDKHREIGSEATPDEYLATLVGMFREIRRVLRPDGTCWVNMGDSYAGSATIGRNDAERLAVGAAGGHGGGTTAPRMGTQNRPVALFGAKPKDLLLMPARLALALQAPYYTGKIKSEADRIWLAAMIDTEGCLFIHKRKAGTSGHSYYTKADGTETEYYRTQDSFGSGLEVANTSLAIVERCKQITGLGSICSQSPDQNNRRKQTIYRWNLRTNECRDVVREVYSHLVAKQQQARILIGCPPSGDKAAAAHAAMIALHNGDPTDVDFPKPESMWEPGWFVRSDVIWNKPNPMPESCTDRPTSAYEHVFLLARSARYFYDADAVREAHTEGTHSRGGDKTNGRDALIKSGHWNTLLPTENPAGRNLRNVWTIATHAYPDAHFATFPPELAERCIKAGTKPGDTVLDPFAGAGTTLLVADRLQRDAVGIELSPDYTRMAMERCRQDAPLFTAFPPAEPPEDERMADLFTDMAAD